MWSLIYLFLPLISFAFKIHNQIYEGYQYLTAKGLNVTLEDTSYNPTTKYGEISYKLSICFESPNSCSPNPLGIPTLWVTEDLDNIQNSLSVAEVLKIPVIIFVSEDPITIKSDDSPIDLVLRLHPSQLQKISYLMNGMIVTLVYNKVCNCGISKESLKILSIVMLGWIVIFGLWLLISMTYFKHQFFTVHQSIAYLVGYKIFVDLLFLILLFTCPWEKDALLENEAMIESFDTLYRAIVYLLIFLFACVLLLS